MRRLRHAPAAAAPRLATRAERCDRRDHPDQVLGRDDTDQQPAHQRAGHERRRAPQPQRPVVQARSAPRRAAHRRPSAAASASTAHRWRHRPPAQPAADIACRSRQSPARSQTPSPSAPRAAMRFSAAPVTNGSTVNRVVAGTAEMMPIHDGSMPTAFSQTVKNGRWYPSFRRWRRRTAPAGSRIASTQLEMRWGFVIRLASIQLRFARYRGVR